MVHGCRGCMPPLHVPADPRFRNQCHPEKESFAQNCALRSLQVARSDPGGARQSERLLIAGHLLQQPLSKCLAYLWWLVVDVSSEGVTAADAAK